MGMDRIVREEARLIVLRALAEQPDTALNSSLLVEALAAFGLSRTRDWLHVELGWLSDIGAITVLDAGSVRIARLTERGLDHVERRVALPGVKRPSPRAD